MLQSSPSRSSGRHAIVIGGSLAGLLAARALANHFDRVTIIDRDRLSDSPMPRRGLPQANHSHVLLVRGQQILERFFPGLKDELRSNPQLCCFIQRSHYE